MAALSLVSSALAFQVFSSPNGTPYRWNLAALRGGVIPWQVATNAPVIVREAALYATQAWSAATGQSLRFAEGPGGIVIEWDADGGQIPDPLYMAFASFTADAGGNIWSASVVINASSYAWQRSDDGVVGQTVDGKRVADLDTVLLHEIGHLLGLDHSDKDPARIIGLIGPGNVPTMNSVIFPGAQNLHADDIAGIQWLYCGGAGAIVTSPITVTVRPASGRAPLKVRLTQIGGGAGTSWDFGDGTILAGASATHRFMAPGTYVVTVRSAGQAGTITVEVTKKQKVRPRPKKGT